ncbi:hypothetical protein VP01_2468g4 [Puccinia sorghi]|uniref:DUF6818 domain-containing protein n=1 Tax=Puccinia sorghi TaxID=27349 RepID=A0A0L6V674_9BASI|nr:hypothetical protein VP01_2468g4 [Puccinia sorghi]
MTAPTRNPSSRLHPAPSSAQRSLSGSHPAPTGTPSTAPTESAPTSQRRPGHAKDSQGYSGADCSALVEAIKAFHPLGAIEWGFVRDWYNVYGTENNWAPCDLNPLKMKFRALVNHAKPTGDPNCPTYVRDAKQHVNQWMCGHVTIHNQKMKKNW